MGERLGSDDAQVLNADRRLWAAEGLRRGHGCRHADCRIWRFIRSVLAPWVALF